MSQRDHDLGLSLIVFFKGVKAAALLVLGILAITMSKTDLYLTAEKLVDWIGVTAGRTTIHKILHISNTRVVLLGIGSIAYAVVFATEGWFLHRRKTWAEWFTVGVTVSFIPFEVYELVEHATAGKVVTLIANVVIVIYLLVRRLRR